MVSLSDRPSYRLSGAIVQGQAIPDFEVRRVPLARPFQWDVIIGFNFFQNYGDIHLNLATSRARITGR